MAGQGGAMVANSVLRQKLAAGRAQPGEGGPGADRGWRLALARAARDRLALALEVRALTLARVDLAEVLEAPPDRALIALLEGPGDGIGMLALSPEVLQSMVEAQTIGRVAATPPPPRRPTRTDAAMVAGVIDAALADLEASLAQEADLIWAGGWRYAGFLEDPRPLGLMLEDAPLRLIRAEVDLGQGARRGSVHLALPAEGRGALPPAGPPRPEDEAHGHAAFAQGLAAQLAEAEARLDAVLARLRLPLSRVVALQPGEVLVLPAARIDQISLTGLDGRLLAEGKLGQNRGMRALRLGNPVAAAAPPRPAAPAPLAQDGDLRHSA